MSEQTNGAFRDTLFDLSSQLMQGLKPKQESMTILQKHFLLAQAEMLKGFVKVVELELEQLDKKPASVAKREKIVVK